MGKIKNTKKTQQQSSHAYKDTLFRTLFREQSRALELCNAITGTDHPPGTPVKIRDPDSSLLRRYNDLAIEIKGQLLVMVEHQSSICPNMPLRFLRYVTETLYSLIINNDDIYRSTTVKIPAPQFYVLYNGKEKLKKTTLKLSDAFRVKPDGPTLELTAIILDVNHGRGNKTLSKSKSLEGYAYLVAQIKFYEGMGQKRDIAIKNAINKCINEGILADYLKKNFEEVAKMLGWEYDKDAELKIIREEGLQEGRQEGRQEGKEETKIETAIAMLTEGFDESLIAKITQMPIDWVKKILESFSESQETNNMDLGTN